MESSSHASPLGSQCAGGQRITVSLYFGELVCEGAVMTWLMTYASVGVVGVTYVSVGDRC